MNQIQKYLQQQSIQSNKTSFKKCKDCHIEYPFELNEFNHIPKVCCICYCIQNYQFNKLEFVYLFKQLFPELDHKNYKFIWKQSISITQKQKKYSNAQYLIVIQNFYDKLQSRIYQIIEFKSKQSEKLIKQLNDIFISIEIFLFYFINRPSEAISIQDSIVYSIQNFINDTYLEIINNPRMKSILKNADKCFSFCSDFILNQQTKDIILSQFILEELNVMSLFQSMYKDIEYYNLKSIHHIDWFQLGWMNSHSPNKLTSTDYKNLCKRLKNIPNEILLQSNLINISSINTYSITQITSKYIYDIYIEFIQILNNSFNTNVYQHPERIFEIACEKCIQYEKWELNKEQKEAIKFCINNPLTFLIGEAGTGKTSVINAFLKSLYILEPNIRICILTPTGKATIRMKEILNLYQLNFIYTSTIHMFYKMNKNEKKIFDLVIIDETSMFGIEHMKIFIELFKETNQKFIFIGDYQQLPSLCGCDFLFQMKLHNPKYITELKINQRVNNTEISNFLNRIRNTDNYYYNDKLKIEYEFIQKYNFNPYMNNLNQNISSESIPNIQWMNYTDFIKQLDNIYKPFIELLNSNTEIYNIKFPVQTLYYKNMNNIDKEHIIRNELFNQLRNYLLKKVQKYLYDINEVESQLRIKTNSFNSYEYQIGDLIMNKQNIYLEDIQIMNGLFGIIENIYTIVINQRNHIKLYKVKFETIVNENIKSSIFFYHNLNTKHLIKENEIKLKEYLKQYLQPYNYDYLINEKNSHLFYKWYEKCNIEHLQMSYITTIHKAQGSQWDNIVLILDNKKSLNNQLSDVDKQLFYTACSRTKSKLYIVYPDTINNFQLKIRDQSISPMYQSDYFGLLFKNQITK
jgi:hypothetical protein